MKFKISLIFRSLFSICKSSVWNESTNTGPSGRIFECTESNNTLLEIAVSSYTAMVMCWMVLIRAISIGGGTILSIVRNQISCPAVKSGKSKFHTNKCNLVENQMKVEERHFRKFTLLRV